MARLTHGVLRRNLIGDRRTPVCAGSVEARRRGDHMSDVVRASLAISALKRRGATALVLIPAAVALSACMTAKVEAPPMTMAMAMAMPPPMEQLAAPVIPQAPQATPGLAARERFQLALNLLQQGNSM